MRLATGYNLPGGAPERIKRGKEKVVTRAVACAEMKFCGTSERGYTVLMNLKGFIGPAISKIYYGEFDSGSERTLAAWIRHASRTECLRALSGARVSNT